MKASRADTLVGAEQAPAVELLRRLADELGEPEAERQQARAPVDPLASSQGDISIAVRGDMHAARAVGRAAAKLPEFPNPHRVLQSGGIITSGRHTGDRVRVGADPPFAIARMSSPPLRASARVGDADRLV